MGSTRKSELLTQKENEHKTLRFFKNFPNNSFEKNIYLKMAAHQSLPYSERFAKEAGLGITIGITNMPISYVLANLEKSFYPKGTSLGIQPHVWHDKSMRIHARFGTPIGEELIFRGLLLHGLHAGFTKQLGMKETHAATASSLVNSLIFSVMHSKGMRLHTFAGGMIYSGMTYYFDGSLVPAISSHMTSNNIAVSAITRKLRR